jgi:hypothetical protein
MKPRVGSQDKKVVEPRVDIDGEILKSERTF